MNKDNAKDYLPLVQALADGKTIQAKCQVGMDQFGWRDCEGDTSFHGLAENYRIKPEPREIWVNEWADGKRIFDSYGDASLHAMQYPLVRYTARYREVIE